MDRIRIETVPKGKTPSRSMDVTRQRAEHILNRSKGWRLPASSEWTLSGGALVMKAKPKPEPEVEEPTVEESTKAEEPKEDSKPKPRKRKPKAESKKPD